MSLSALPLSYCTNVHSGRTVSEVQRGLDDYTVPVLSGYGKPLAAGLWLARPVVQELLSNADGLKVFAAGLQRRNLTCHTLNAFPYGDFHSARVKEQVYLPDWSQPERFDYTLACAQILTEFLPDGTEGSISTVPLGFKPLQHSAGFVDSCIDQLVRLARRLEQLREETGRLIRLAMEPEPFCLLETTPEVISFFHRLRERAVDEKALAAVQIHLGVCYDVCHQSVEFEDVAASIASLQQHEIRINKVHITCALQLNRPAENREGREALAHYVEPRYLHQTMARHTSGEVLRVVDLTEQLTREPPNAFLQCDAWRIHFHVPVDAEQLGPLGTTRHDLRNALAAVALLDYAPHLEVETYTWEVLPGGNTANLVDGLTRELCATRTLLDSQP